MGYLKSICDETDDEAEIDAEKRALRELLSTFRVRSQIELPDLGCDEEAQQNMARFIALHALKRQTN